MMLMRLTSASDRTFFACSVFRIALNAIGMRTNYATRMTITTIKIEKKEITWNRMKSRNPSFDLISCRNLVRSRQYAEIISIVSITTTIAKK